jgi:hypothetical protein
VSGIVCPDQELRAIASVNDGHSPTSKDEQAAAKERERERTRFQDSYSIKGILIKKPILSEFEQTIKARVKRRRWFKGEKRRTIKVQDEA